MPEEQFLSQITNWVSWCHRKQTDPFSNHLREVLDFFAEIFELGFEYSTINTHRSAMFVFREPIGVFCGKAPKLLRLDDRCL